MTSEIVTRTSGTPRPRLVLAAVMVAGAVCLVAATIPADMAVLAVPTVAAIAIFVGFALALRSRAGPHLFGDLGFLYLALTLAYTVAPGASFLFLNVEDDLIGQLLPTPAELGAHLWRHVLFMCGVAAGYLLLRGRDVAPRIAIHDEESRDGKTIAVLVALIAVCVACLTLLSAPVQGYHDHYVRYDHLSWLPRKLISLCVRLKLGLSTTLLTFLFLNYRKYRVLIPFVVGAICVWEISHSRGSRIETLIVLLSVVCLYHYAVKPVTLKMGLVASVAMVALFSVVELARISDDAVTELELRPASELGAVYFPGFHLYAERAQGALPPREWPMFFNDFISLVTFADFTLWNPQHWYARNYYPDAPVAPWTLGPIADSAMWGGEPDLVVRGLVNGLFFAYLMRWFLKRKDRWWAVAVYVFCFSTCILALKYSIFWHLVPLLKTVTPTLLLVALLRGKRRASSSSGSAPADPMFVAQR